MRYFSTFSGIGGFEVGIHNAFAKLSQGDTNEQNSDDTSDKLVCQSIPVCVGYSEIDKYASSVYERHLKGVKNYGDITTINAEELPDFDCLVGGFPCQAFSIAGKRRGFEDTRGTLFFDLARILQAKQPRLFVFENVKGLLSHDMGRTFRTILATLTDLGYDCQWQVLNSKNFGVPQNRERIIIVGHLRGTPRPEVFPIGQSGRTLDEHISKRPWLWGRAVSNAVDANYFKGHDGKRQLIGEGLKIRRLTPVECERLQGFPDNWTAQGTDGAISDTQRYKMCGNAVTTNVIQAVFEQIFKGGL